MLTGQSMHERGNWRGYSSSPMRVAKVLLIRAGPVYRYYVLQSMGPSIEDYSGGHVTSSRVHRGQQYQILLLLLSVCLWSAAGWNGGHACQVRKKQHLSPQSAATPRAAAGTPWD
jgi:hypothetical protein